MNRRFILLTDADLAGELAISLAIVPELDVQLGKHETAKEAHVVSPQEEPLHSLDFSTWETLIVTGASSATALLTFAQAMLEFLRNRRNKDSSETAAPQISIVVNNNFIVTADTSDGVDELASYLGENEVRRIVVARERLKPNDDDG